MRGARRLRLREALRRTERELAAARAELADLAPIARLGIVYVHEIDAPNIREPWSIANRRADLADAVHGRDARIARRARRAA